MNIAVGGQVDLNGTTLQNTGTISDQGTINGTVNNGFGGVLKGAGNINGALILADGSLFSPGNSPGSMTTGSGEMRAGGTYVFEMRDATGAAGVGVDYWNIAGPLDILAGLTVGDFFTIQADTLAAGNVPGLADNWNNSLAQSWVLAHADGSISGFAPGEFVVDSSFFMNDLSGGSLFVSTSPDGHDLLLNFQPVPEPSPWAGAALLLLARISRRRKCHPHSL